MRLPVGVSKFSDLKIATKLGVLVLVLSIPIMALVLVQYRAGTAAISREDAEADGMNYVEKLVTVMAEVQNHRALAQRVLNGDGASQAALDQSTVGVESALEALRKQDAGTGNAFQTSGLLAAVTDQWQTLRATPSSRFPGMHRAHKARACPGPLPSAVGHRRASHRRLRTATRYGAFASGNAEVWGQGK